jgi:DNA-nicking Smr family endonuclease
MARRSQRAVPQSDPFDPLDGPTTAEIDLHGMTATEARARVTDGLARVHKSTPGELVHIITGKGNNSPGRPVLKGMVKSMLASGKLSQVARWGPDDAEGGYLVRLKGGRF